MNAPLPDAIRNNLIQIHSRDPLETREELVTGLCSVHAYVSPKYLYDNLGSKLFSAICELEEYYPTRTEAQIFTDHLDEIAASVGHGATLIDLGAGDCRKAERLIPVLHPKQYVPVDISVEFLRDAVGALHCRFPQLPTLGLGLDFSSSLALPDAVYANKRLFFYPGSSIGNYSPDQAIDFLKRIRLACDHEGICDGSILIGVDLVKEKALLDAAYDDSLGVTAAFNLNMLLHLNRILDADFNLKDWRHVGFFNTELSRVEMHLEARHNLSVRWRGGQRRFERGESIHTESSYKYTQKNFLALLKQAGFGNVKIWTDPRAWFMVCHAQAI